MDQLKALITSPRTEKIITALIVLNAITLGLETSAWAMANFGAALLMLDRVILAVFVAEIAIKLVVYRLGFFRNAWNVFDFVIVGISLMPVTEGMTVLRALRVLRAFFKDPWSLFDFAIVGIALVPAAGAFSVLRALRILRVLRMITLVPSLRRVVGALISALPGMGSIILLMTLIFYVASVMATKLFAADFPEWFGSIPASAYSLFQVMTLESWSMGIVRPVMEVYPYAWAFFVPFILCTTFTMLNLFIGIVVNAMQSEHEEEAKAERQQIEADLREASAERQRAHAEDAADLAALRNELAALRQEIGALSGRLADR